MDIREKSIEADEILKFLYISGALSGIQKTMARNKRIRELSGEYGIRVTDEELQSIADNIRKLLNLYSANEMISYLEKGGMTLEDFESYCETMLFDSKLKEQVVKEEQIVNFFYSNRSRFDKARVYVIRVDNENLASEIEMQFKEDGEDFHKLARNFSIDESTKYAGGYAGLLGREHFQPAIEAKVFSAQNGELLGPFAVDDKLLLILVQEVLRANLDDSVKEEIRSTIYEEILEKKFS